MARRPSEPTRSSTTAWRSSASSEASRARTSPTPSAVNYQTIGYLERNEYNPSLDLALRAAEYFGLPVEAIFSRRPFAPMSSQWGSSTRPPCPGRTRTTRDPPSRRTVLR